MYIVPIANGLAVDVNVRINELEIAKAADQSALLAGVGVGALSFLLPRDSHV